MSDPLPTQEQAAAALAEAGLREAQVRRADLQLVWMLVALLAADIGVALLLSLAPHNGTPLASAGILALLITAIVLVVIVGLRIRAYSRSGIRIYFATIVAFNVWNAFVMSVSLGTRFWAMGQPIYHFGISEVVGALPVVAGIWLLSRGADGD